jgi:hypothetical protein
MAAVGEASPALHNGYGAHRVSEAERAKLEAENTHLSAQLWTVARRGAEAPVWPVGPAEKRVTLELDSAELAALFYRTLHLARAEPESCMQALRGQGLDVKGGGGQPMVPPAAIGQARDALSSALTALEG